MYAIRATFDQSSISVPADLSWKLLIGKEMYRVTPARDSGPLLALMTASATAQPHRRRHFRKRDHMKALCYKFVREESGQDLIEYGLLIGIITVAAITAITAIGPKVGSYYSNAETQLP